MSVLLKLLIFIASTTLVFVKVKASKNESFVPYFLCDIKGETVETIYNCVGAIIPPKVKEELDKKLKSLLKGKSLVEYMPGICKEAPKILSNGKEFEALMMTALKVCWNATVYWVPYEPKTRYQDIGLFFN